MKKVYMVLVPNLPCPSVKGGAIETLLTNVANENEKNKKIDLNIISIYNKDAYMASKKYKNTKFIFIKQDGIGRIPFKIYKTLRQISGDPLKYSYYYHRALKSIPDDVDYIIAEGGVNEYFIPFKEKFGKKKMVIHLHYELESNKMLNNIFGNIISVSKFIEKRYNPDETVVSKVLKNGVDIEKFSKEITEKEKKELRNKLAINQSDFVIIFCGRLIKEKGILELIETMENINQTDIKLLVVGSSNFGNNIVTEFEKILNEKVKKLEDKIIFTGFVNNDDLYKMYKISDLQVIPSIWDDPAPLTAIEGMVSGLPIVATKSGGMIEYINEDCSIIIDKDEKIKEELNSAILELYNSEDKRKMLGKNGLNRSKQFSVQNYYSDFVNILNELR